MISPCIYFYYSSANLLNHRHDKSVLNIQIPAIEYSQFGNCSDISSGNFACSRISTKSLKSPWLQDSSNLLALCSFPINSSSPITQERTTWIRSELLTGSHAQHTLEIVPSLQIKDDWNCTMKSNNNPRWAASTNRLIWNEDFGEVSIHHFE